MAVELDSVNLVPRKTAWSPHRWLLCIALLLAVIGGSLLTVGILKPAYVDHIAAERLISGIDCDLENNAPDGSRGNCNGKSWYQSMNALRTNKWPFVDAGRGLLLSALSLFIFAQWMRRKNWGEMVTPGRITILVLASLGWLMQMPALTLHLMEDLSRDCCPHWADSLGVSLMGILFGVLAGFLPCIAVWSMFVVGARLPAPVFSQLRRWPFLNIFWSSAAALLLCIPIAVYLVAAIFGGPVLMVPVLWLMLWLSLCARSAALTRHHSTR